MKAIERFEYQEQEVDLKLKLPIYAPNIFIAFLFYQYDVQ